MIRMTYSIAWAVALLVTLAGCGGAANDTNQSAQNAGAPGWTGRTLVPGSHSAISTNAGAAQLQQHWGGNGGGGGGGGGGM
jgi:hypothetical protein